MAERLAHCCYRRTHRRRKQDNSPPRCRLTVALMPQDNAKRVFLVPVLGATLIGEGIRSPNGWI